MNIIFTAKTIIDGNFALKEPVQILYCLHKISLYLEGGMYMLSVSKEISICLLYTSLGLVLLKTVVLIVEIATSQTDIFTLSGVILATETCTSCNIKDFSQFIFRQNHNNLF